MAKFCKEIWVEIKRLNTFLACGKEEKIPLSLKGGDLYYENVFSDYNW